MLICLSRMLHKLWGSGCLGGQGEVRRMGGAWSTAGAIEIKMGQWLVLES